MMLLTISSCPAVLLCFTDLKTFSNTSKVSLLHSIFFCTGNRKSSNVLDVFCILMVRFGPAFVKYLWNPSVMRLFFFIDFLLTFIDLGNLLELTFSRDFFYYFPCACHVILTILKYRLTVCLLSFFMQFSKKMFIVLVDLFIFNRFIF